MYLLLQEQFHKIAVNANSRFLLSTESITMNLKHNDKFALHCHEYRCLTCCSILYDIAFCTKQAYVEPVARSICVLCQSDSKQLV